MALEKRRQTIPSFLVFPAREDGSVGAIRSLERANVYKQSSAVLNRFANTLQRAKRSDFAKTKESALVDPLTELPNARAFYMLLGQRIAECQRMNNESLAVISIDIDDFKTINDVYGHAIGDRVLASIAGVIRKELRQMDILTRYAGDEFVAIMQGFTRGCRGRRANSRGG